MALFYIVHLEALKYDLQPIPRSARRGRRSPARSRPRSAALGTLAVCAVLYYVVTGVQRLFGPGGGLGPDAMLRPGAPISVSSPSPRATPICRPTIPTAPIIRLPEPWPTVRSGLHFTIPLIVLLWCLMVEELSPGSPRSGPP